MRGTKGDEKMEFLKELWNYGKDKRNSASMRKKAIKGFSLFLVLIISFTILSRAAASMTVPQVNTEYPAKKNLEFPISVEGKVEENQVQAINVLENIKVASIYVNAGQKVAAGDDLFQLSLEDLEEKKRALEYDLTKLELDKSDLESSKDVAEQKSDINIKRANENYSNTVTRSNMELTNAYNDMIKAQNELVEFQNSGTTGTAADSQVEQVLQNTVTEKESALTTAVQNQEQTIQEIEQKILTEQERQQQLLTGEEKLSSAKLSAIEEAVRVENQSLLDTVNDVAAEAQQSLLTAREALTTYQTSNAQSQQASIEEQEKALLDSYESKRQSYELLVQSNGMTVLDAARVIEDANAEEAQVSNMEVLEMDIELKKKELGRIVELIEQEGIIVSPITGIVTESTVTVGGKTTDGAAMFLADTSKGNKFVAQLTKEQQKYISRNDKVTLRTADGKQTVENLTIDLMTPSKENNETMDITVLIPAGELEVGTSAALKFTKMSAQYNTCVPIEAIRTDSMNKTYVLVIVESDTVLGTELQVVRSDVTILDKNEKFAALSDSDLAANQQVVISSDKEIKAGDRVRLAD